VKRDLGGQCVRRCPRDRGFKEMYGGFATWRHARSHTPGHVAGAAVWLASDLSRQVTANDPRRRRLQHPGRPEPGRSRLAPPGPRGLSDSRAAAHDRDVGEVDRKPRADSRAATIEEASSALISQAPRSPTVECPCSRPEDMVLPVPVRPVAMAHDAQLLEDLQRPIDGRGDRGRILLPAALDEDSAVTWPRVCESTVTSARRCGVQRRPCACSARARTPTRRCHRLETLARRAIQLAA